jgi:hypothetical protein
VRAVFANTDGALTRLLTPVFPYQNPAVACLHSSFAAVGWAKHASEGFARSMNQTILSFDFGLVVCAMRSLIRTGKTAATNKIETANSPMTRRRLRSFAGVKSP